MRSKSSLTEGPIIRSLLALAVPIVFANILQSAYQLTDAFWVGRLGGSAIAAVSVSFPITFLLIAMGAGLAVAGSTLIAQYVGARNETMVNHVAAQTLLMVAAVSIVLGAVGYALAPDILHLMGVAPDVFFNALGFMRITFAGLVFTFGFVMFQSVMRGVGQVTMPLYIVAGTVLLNFVLDPFFIFGYGPIPALGVAGAALATLCTQTIAAVIGFVTLLRGRYGIHLEMSDFKPDLKFIRRAFLLGFPASIEQSARALGLTVLTFLITSFGTLTVAAYGVGSTILQFVIIPAMGLSLATSTLVGQNIGAGNVKRAEEIARLSALIAFGALSAIGVIVFTFAPALIGVFIPGDPAVIRAGSVFLRIVALTFGFMGMQLALTGVFRAAGNMVATMILALVSQWVLQFPIAYVLSKHTTLGATGIWWAFPISNVAIALITLVWFMRGDWQKASLTEDDKISEQVMEEVLLKEGTI
jgi:putative MATE family efflux protein